LDINIFSLAFGFVWGWLFIPGFMLSAAVADYLNKEVAIRMTGTNLWLFRIVCMISIIVMLGSIYWHLYVYVHDSLFPENSREFGMAMVVGFLSFVLLPRIEAAFRKTKIGK